MRILAVVVLYKCSLGESQTIRGFTQAVDLHPQLRNSMRLLVWDNSPTPLADPRLSLPFEYRHSPQNVGVSGAYNEALRVARELSCPWMLLLDHDTTLTLHYLLRMKEYSQQLESREDIAAIAPFLADGKQRISPARIRFYGISFLPLSASGTPPGKLYAANSGTLMRVSALYEIGGYDERFWLDYSDIVTFHNFHQQGKRLYVAGDLQLSHVISSNDYDGMMSPERYRNFMSAEDAYCDLYRPCGENAIQTCRLLARAAKQYLRFRNKEFSEITWQYFLGRIFLSKAQRLMRWKRDPSLVAEGQAIR